MSELENKVNEQNPNVNPIPEKEKSAKELEREKIEAATKAFEEKGGKVENLNKKINASKPPKRKRQKSSKPSKAKKGTGTAQSSTGRKPILSSWRMLCIKKGTKLTCRIDGKVSEKYFACTISEAGMNLDVTIKGRKNTTETDGLMRAEMLVRSILKKPVAKPQGWDFWGIEKKGKWTSIHSLFETTDRATLLNRRNY
jgi:hypothetical protein